MPHYKYTALLRSGEKISGMMDGLNEMDAAARIRESCDVILKLTEVGNDKPGLLNMELGSRLNGKAFSVMCSQFAIILDAGIPIARAVKLVAEKTVGKPLDANITLYVDDKGKAVLDKLSGQDLKTLFIVSGVKIVSGDGDGYMGETEGVKVKVVANTAPKCVRCWTHDEGVGEDPDHPELCPRCARVVRFI